MAKDDCLKCGFAEKCSGRGTPCALAMSRIEYAKSVIARRGSAAGEDEPNPFLFENRGAVLKEQEGVLAEEARLLFA